MEELEGFFKNLVKDTNLSEKISSLEVFLSKQHEKIEVNIDYCEPVKGRNKSRSKKLIFILPEEFLSDHQNNLIDSLPRNNIIYFINNFNFENQTQSNVESKPFEKYVINTDGSIKYCCE